MATYNGALYINEQISSILKELDIDDEVVIVDDCSTDNTLNVLRDINDPRIKMHTNDRNRGHVYSFNRAISLAQNDIVFLSDQDDIWLEGRVKLMVNKLLDNKAMLISSNYELMDENGEGLSFPQRNQLKLKDSSRYLTNILKIFMGKMNYFGCAMAFRKELAEFILPIPDFVEAHDIWLSLAGNLAAANLHIEEKTLRRRLHSMNLTNPNRRILDKIKSRIIFLRSILILRLRMKSRQIS